MAQVTLHFYAIRVEEHRLVAAEIDPPAAAALLDAAHPLLLGTAEDLTKVAQRFRRPLVTIARSEPRRPLAAVRTTPESLPPGVPATIAEPAVAVSQGAARSLFKLPWRSGRARGQTAARVA
jgi:hypothetical protein